MKMFVTGGTGFIGSHFLNQAIEGGNEVLALRRSSESRSRVPLAKNPEWLDKQMPEVEPGDLRGCETLVHFAVHSANVPYDSLGNCLHKNVIEPLALFGVAREAGVRRFVVAGTCFEYGTAGERYEEIPVDAPLEPTASYPASKAAATSVFWTFAVSEQVEMSFLRIFQVYGEGEPDQRFWPTLRRKALAGEDMEMSPGLQVRDFVHVSDVAAQFLRAATEDKLDSGVPVIKHVGSGQPRSLADFAESEWERFGATGKLVFGAVPMRKEEVLRYVPEIS